MHNQSVTSRRKPLKVVSLWDPTTRIFHWIFAALVSTTWILGKFGPDVMVLHFWFGYSLGGLLLFRVVWGFVGSTYSRFSSFIYTPAMIIRYAKSMNLRKPSYWLGHNPVGGLFVIAILLVLTAQLVTGVFSDPEDYLNIGPLSQTVSIEWRRFALSWHTNISWIVLILVSTHVVAVLFYLIWKKENLILPMIHGRKQVLGNKDMDAP